MRHRSVTFGLTWPLQIDASGALARAGRQDAVRLSVLAILGTHPGERVMRPTYGCPLRSLVFSPNDLATANLAQFHVLEALARWEPRIALSSEDVRVTNRTDEHGPFLFIEVKYRVRATGEADSLVFQLPLT